MENGQNRRQTDSRMQSPARCPAPSRGVKPRIPDIPPVARARVPPRKGGNVTGAQARWARRGEAE
eukprot:12056419-Alexandrium_andersonii.AAC.1